MSEGKDSRFVEAGRLGGRNRRANEEAMRNRAAVLEAENAKLHELNRLLIDTLAEVGAQDRLAAVLREVA